MNNDDRSFRLDRKVRSFHIGNFTFRDLPLLGLAFVLLTLFNLVFGWLPARLLPEKWLWLYSGLLLGFFGGILVCLRFRRPVPAATAPEI